jgi:hypothetical protein
MAISAVKVTRTQPPRSPADTGAMKTLLTALFLATTTLAHADGFTTQDLNNLHRTVGSAQQALGRINSNDEADVASEAELTKRAADCSGAVKDALGKGADAATQMSFTDFIAGKRVDVDVTIGEIDVKICQALAEKAKGLDERHAKAAAAAAEAKLGPFKKLGVAGDKLALVDKFWTEVLGPNEANPTPQVVAKSSVLFRLIKDDDFNYTLMRYQFRGNKQVRVTTQSFHHDPAASSYR